MMSVEQATLTSKGQVTIPVAIRRSLDANEGDKLGFLDMGDGTVVLGSPMLIALREAQNAFREIRKDTDISTIDDVVALVNEVRKNPHA